jgi:hypothetical protein
VTSYVTTTNGNVAYPSIDPVVFRPGARFKLMLVSYLENLTSDRKLVDHCSVRMDILYFLGYDIDEQLPWHSTISRTRQLYPGAVFEGLFNKVFSMCVDKRYGQWTYPGHGPRRRPFCSG